MMRCLVFSAIAICLLAGRADVEPLFHATFDGTLEAVSAAGAGTPLAVEGAVEYAPGRIGQALVCGPELGAVRYRLAGNLLPAAGTISLWVKPLNWTPADGNFHVFLEAGSEGGRMGWLLLYKYYQSGWLLLRIADEKGHVGMANRELRWREGEWHHVAATWSVDGLKIFVDGELLAQADQPVVADNLGDFFLIGDRGWHLPHQGARTLLDDVRIYGYPLPLAQIRRLAQQARLQVMRDPLEDRWQVEVAVPEEPKAGRAVVEVMPAGDGKPLKRAEARMADGMARVQMPVADLKPGEYRVQAQVVDESGERIMQAGPVAIARRERERVILENAHLRMVFNGATGSILAIEARRLGYSARAPQAPRPLVALETVSFADHARFYQARDVKVLEAGEGHLQRIGVIRSGKVQRMQAEYRFPPDISVAVSVELPDDSPVAAFRLKMKNVRPVRPSQAVIVPRVTFPAVSGLRIGEDAADDALASGRIQGEVIPGPAAHLPEERVLYYPGFSCVPWLDLHDAVGGLYLGPLTDGTCQLEVLSGAHEGLVDIGARWWALVYPGESWESPPVEMAVHPGRWHWAAERFRNWSLRNTPPRKQPDWLDESDGWLGMGGPGYTFRDLPKVLEAAKYYGFFYLQLWSQMILGEQYYSYFYPNPDLGTEDDLRKGIAKVHAAGGYIGFYSNVITFDGAIEANDALRKAIARHRLQNLPRLPRFWGEMAKSVSVDPAGRYGRSEVGYLDGYWAMCPGAEGWQDYLTYWISRWHRSYGADIWYLDSFPVFGYGLGPACFAEHHSHPQGLGPGQIALLRRIREEFQGPLLYEGPACAAFLPYTNWVLGEEFAFGPDRFSRPDIFVYSFSDVYPVFAGSCNTWQGVSVYYPDLKEPRHEDTMNRVFLLGERFDTLGLYPPQKGSPFGEHVRRLVALRKKVRDIVYKGRFMEELGLAGMPEKVEARAFVRQNRPGAVLTVVDRRPQRAPWTVQIDTRSLPWPRGLTGARLLQLDGSGQRAEMERQRNLVQIHLAPKTEVYAVRIE